MQRPVPLSSDQIQIASGFQAVFFLENISLIASHLWDLSWGLRCLPDIFFTEIFFTQTSYILASTSTTWFEFSLLYAVEVRKIRFILGSDITSGLKALLLQTSVLPRVFMMHTWHWKGYLCTGEDESSNSTHCPSAVCSWGALASVKERATPHTHGNGC